MPRGGNRTGRKNFSRDGEYGREAKIFCRGGIRAGKKIFSSDWGGEGEMS